MAMLLALAAQQQFLHSRSSTRSPARATAAPAALPALPALPGPQQPARATAAPAALPVPAQQQQPPQPCQPCQRATGARKACSTCPAAHLVSGNLRCCSRWFWQALPQGQLAGLHSMSSSRLMQPSSGPQHWPASGLQAGRRQGVLLSLVQGRSSRCSRRAAVCVQQLATGSCSWPCLPRAAVACTLLGCSIPLLLQLCCCCQAWRSAVWPCMAAACTHCPCLVWHRHCNGAIQQT
jgi:hypothetical protein